jgi:hypothetical protein
MSPSQGLGFPSTSAKNMTLEKVVGDLQETPGTTSITLKWQIRLVPSALGKCSHSTFRLLGLPSVISHFRSRS